MPFAALAAQGVLAHHLADRAIVKEQLVPLNLSVTNTGRRCGQV
jgi:hypothetical protein